MDTSPGRRAVAKEAAERGGHIVDGRATPPAGAALAQKGIDIGEVDRGERPSPTTVPTQKLTKIPLVCSMVVAANPVRVPSRSGRRRAARRTAWVPSARGSSRETGASAGDLHEPLLGPDLVERVTATPLAFLPVVGDGRNLG